MNAREEYFLAGIDSGIQRPENHTRHVTTTHRTERMKAVERRLTRDGAHVVVSNENRQTAVDRMAVS